MILIGDATKTCENHRIYQNHKSAKLNEPHLVETTSRSAIVDSRASSAQPRGLVHIFAVTLCP